MKNKTGYILGARVWGNMNIGPGHYIVAPAGIVGAFNTTGQVFFVNGTSGSDTTLTPGDPSTPLATIAAALALCTSGQDDYIIVEDYWQTGVITVNKTRVHIIGLSTNPNNPFVAISALADTTIFLLSSNSNDVEIAGFNLGGGATHAAIEDIAGTCMGAYIHDCQFGHSFAGNTPQDGIRCTANMTALRVENCKFLGNGGSVPGTLTRDGIRFIGAGVTLNGGIVDNLFMGCAGIAINLSRVSGFEICRNDIAVPTDTAGQAITLAAVSVGNYIAENRALYGNSSPGMVNNPYVDLAVAGSNHWVENFRGSALTDPA